MAFEKIYKFIDKMAELYKKKYDMQYIYCLVEFYETALQEPRLKQQKAHCMRTIYEINPGFFKGYFKRNHP